LKRKRRKKIMVIDDNKEVIELVEMILEVEGYKVIGVSNSLDAYNMAVKTKPSLIILDVMMPKMDGWQVLEKIKENPSTGVIPVILLSVRAEMEFKKGIETGVEAIMRKPFEPVELIEAVRKILEAEKK